MSHISVLTEEILTYADPRPNKNFIDATLGSGGHALAILGKTSPEGKLLGIDLDRKAIDGVAEKVKNTEFQKRLILACGNFADLGAILKKNNFGPVQGIIADLGLSSMELEERGRGFTFLKDEPLDMRYGEYQENKNILTAEEIVNNWDQEKIAEILFKYGEERFSRQIAERIIQARKINPIRTTFQLSEIIKQATPGWYGHRRLHQATKTFQALRIAVNDELNNLKKFLEAASQALEKSGRLAIISFHSLEDRIVKNFLKEKKQQNLFQILTKKVIRPSEMELKQNPRSRSAKLRVAEKL